MIPSHALQPYPPRAGGRRRGPLSGAGRAFRPRLETLETRELLSVFGDPFLLPGDAAPEPAAERQASPQIAQGGDLYLTVWADRRTALLEHHLDRRAGLGTLWDIYAARFDAAGNVLDTTPIIVSQAPHDQLSPRVGWNGQNWLVAWQTQRATQPGLVDVMAARVSPDGQVLDPAPIVVDLAESGSPLTPWAVSSDGTNWVVAWRDVVPGIWTIDGARVSPDGVVLDPGGLRLRQDTFNSFPVGAQLAFAGDEYLMVWHEGQRGALGTAVRGQRFTPALEPVGPLLTLSDRNSARLARVASDGNDFFAVWYEDLVFYDLQLRGTRVTHDGTVVVPGGFAVVGNIGPAQYGPAVTWTGAQWVAAFDRGASVGFFDVYAARVAADDTPLDPKGIPVKVGPGQSIEVAVAAGADGQVQVVWAERPPAGAFLGWLPGGGATGTQDTNIDTAVLQPDGSVTADYTVSLGAPRQSTPRLVYNGDGFLAVFRSEVSGQMRILAQRLDALGNPLDDEPVLLAAGRALMNPSVAWNGSVYLAVWEDSAVNRVFGRRLLADGTPADAAPFLVMAGNMPDTAALGDTFLVVASFPQTSQRRFTEAVRVGGDGAVLDSPLRLGNNFDLFPRVAAFPDRWVVVWEENITHDNPNSRIAVAFVGLDGSRTARIVVGGGDTPHVAVSGDTALVVWSTSPSVNADIRGNLVRADGTVLAGSTGFVISAAPGRELIPAVAWDGTQYVVAWHDQRQDVFPLHPRGDVFAARVAPGGTVLDPQGFPVANSPRPEETPFVVSGGGLTLFAYAGFADFAPYAALRITLRTFFDDGAAPGGPAPGDGAALAALAGRDELPRAAGGAGRAEPAPAGARPAERTEGPRVSSLAVRERGLLERRFSDHESVASELLLPWQFLADWAPERRSPV